MEQVSASQGMTRLPLLSTPRSFIYTPDAREPVYGVRLGFKNLTEDERSVGAGRQPQYFVDVVDVCERRVMFIFTNREPDTSSITDIFFNDEEFFSISVQIKPVAEMYGDTSPGIPCLTANNHCMPDPYQDSTSFRIYKCGRIGADYDTAPYGINRDESLGIVFDLRAGATMASITRALRDKTLNVGIKIQRDPPGSTSILINDPSLDRNQSLHP